MLLFIWFWLVFHPSWFCLLRTGGASGGEGLSTVSKSKVTNLKIPGGVRKVYPQLLLFIFFSGIGQFKSTFYIFHQPILFQKEISVAMCFMLQSTNTVMDEMYVKKPRNWVTWSHRTGINFPYFIMILLINQFSTQYCRVSHRRCEHGGGAPQNSFGRGLKSKHGGAWGSLKMLSKDKKVAGYKPASLPIY